MEKVLLVILDGWGASAETKGNACVEAETPFMDKLLTSLPSITLQAAAQAVGLPFGEMGNSEVGHLNIGLGRVFLQDLPQINKAIESGEFFKKETLKKLISHIKSRKSSLHILGIASNGAVHGHLEHILTSVKFAKNEGLDKVFLHLFTDGRDTKPKAAEKEIGKFEGDLQKIGLGQIVTISGRYYAMDRDKRWERTELAYNAIVRGQGETAPDTLTAIKNAYKRGESDEFIKPTVIGQPVKISSGDGLLFTNYRADRILQIAKAFVDPHFSDFKQETLNNLFVAGFTLYEAELPIEIVFPPLDLADPRVNPQTNPLAQLLTEKGVTQFHLAESEKYAHVTYFFNGGVEKPFPKEERFLVPSPKVKTYDLKPEMSAPQVAKKLKTALESSKYQFIIVNFANPDMVGHTGNLKACIQGLNVLDKLIAELIPLSLKNQFHILITADHGNAEEMLSPLTGEVEKEHTLNPVPFIYLPPSLNLAELKPQKEVVEFYGQPPTGVLADVAPSVLAVLGIDKPKEMTGLNLLEYLK